MKTKKKVEITLFSLLIVIILAGAGLIKAGFYFYNVAVVPNHKTFVNDNQALQEQGRQWFHRMGAQKWEQTSATQHLKLDANYLPARQKTNRTVVIAHGFMGDKETMLTYAKLFHQLGYNILVPDDRGQGASQGHYIGFGWPDRLDYVKWLKRVVKHTGKRAKIVMFGVSMGGATTMMTSGQPNVPHQVKGYIEDCGYDSVNHEINYQAKQLYHMPKFLRRILIPVVSAITNAKDGYSFKAANATKQVKRNHRPMLFIHGEADQFVPTWMVYRLYRADRGPKQLLIVRGAPHAASYQTNPQQYRRTITIFLKRYFR